ncbi:MAG: glycosyltransferase [Candidatus Oleimicrobiaceae bacterium]
MSGWGPDNVGTRTRRNSEATLGETFRLAYILWKFPRLSETFIVNELFFLRQATPGLQVRLLAVNKGEGGAEHRHVAELCEPGMYLPAWYKPCFVVKVLSELVKGAAVVVQLLRELAGLVSSQSTFPRKLYAGGQAAYGLAKGLYAGSVLRKQQVEHVHAHFAESGGLVAFVAAAVAGIPYSLTLHGHDIFFNPNPRLPAFLIRHSRFALTVSEFNRGFLLESDPGAAKKLRVHHCGVDMALFRPREGQAPERFRMLTVARLQPRKGIADLVEACRLLQGELDFACVIIGDGPQRGELEAKVAHYGLAERFHFRGACSQEEVVDELGRASVFVLPSYSEGLPVSVMEAMAMQVPVVATRVNGVPELVREGTGILVDPGDVRALAQALRRIATLPPRERRAMGQKARALVEKEFNIRVQSRLLAELLVAGAGGKEGVKAELGVPTVEGDASE